MNGQNEQELIVEAQKGSKDAFLALYRAHVDVLYRTLLARIGHKETVEDLVQETFLRALNALPSFVPQRSASFRAWLFRIAMNLYISQYRKQKRVIALTDDTDIQIGQTDDVDFDRIFLQGAIEKLDEKDQEVIMLRYFSDLSYEEIAVALEMRVSAVGVRLHRALKKLKGKLSPPKFLHHL